MIGASCCCHVTLLILLLALRLTFANINTPAISSSSSVSPSSPLLSLSHSLPQSSSLGSSLTSQAATPTFRISSETSERLSSQATDKKSGSQSKSVLVSNDQSEHNTSPKTPPIFGDSQSNTLSDTNDQSQHEAAAQDFPPQITPSSVVMQTILSSPAVDHAPQSTQSKSLTISKRAKFKLTASSKDQLKLLAIEKLFLKNIGLERRPRIEADYAVPEYMLKLYHSHVGGSRDGHKHVQVKGNGAIAGNTVRSFVHTETEVTSCKPPLCSRVHFDIATIPEDETLAGAELRVFVDTTLEDRSRGSGRTSSEPQNGAVEPAAGPTCRNEALFRVEVHEIMRPDSPDGDVISRLLDTRVVSHGNSTWHSFDIRPAVLRWKRGHSHNHGLEVRLVAKAPNISVDNHVRLRRSAILQDRQWALQRPLLVTYTNDGLSPSSTSASSSSRSSRLTRLKRRRRQTSDEDNKNNKRNRRKKNKKRRKKKGNKNMCKKHGLYVNFNDVGWDDWIVAPPGYSAYYCHGDCMAPLPHFTKASNHAMLQARVYKVDPSSVPMVCCVPSKMSQISMLYRDEKGRTVLKNYQDMAVVECSCK